MLERIALEFEPGRHYDEQQVNVIAGRFFSDYASLRRYLVDEGFLDREGGGLLANGGQDRPLRARGLVIDAATRHGPTCRRSSAHGGAVPRA